ncbi:serine-rich adhesin for platelets isoform X2 [Adelges cooleyi]|uniref:serine-rich adhesin for platelets isoform X2 n=1 Tax=Adelges cooleyi TaxID=133065 RepID=UPI00217F4DB3|nr:serine-rich adhesin for platelets isoform X2 [Adelges cooleyi]
MLDMALGSNAPTGSYDRSRLTVALLLIVCATLVKSAPTTIDEIEPKRTDIADYYANSNGCYYNYQHYEEGDRIVTNEPCLNCTCHNRMLMCFLRVCPFTKAIGQDCTVQKSPDQCCPTISCPEVPVELLTSSTTPQPTTTTTVGWQDNYGCMMNDNEFFPDGAQLPISLQKPCELCYCIRNRTACVMQECTLHVEGCRPVYLDGVCCPVRYDCDYENDKSTTSTPQITGGLVFSTTSAPFDCRVGNEVYNDGESIPMLSEKPCHHCYCMRGDIVCAVQDCGEPLRGKDCTPEPPPAGQCCPTSYRCANDTINSDDVTTLQPISLSDSDEHEAEKHPSLEEAYEKLGENQPTSQDALNDEVQPAEAEQSTNKNEASNSSVNENQSNADEQAGISEVSATTQNNEQPSSETVSQDNPEVVASDENTNAQETGTTNSPTEENLVSSTPQQTSDDKTDVKVTEENTSIKNPSEQINQDENKTTNPISNETPEISQTESPITTNQDSNTSISDDKNENENSEINTESNIKQDTPLQSNQDSTERPVEVINAQTDVPSEVDQSTLKPSEQDNAQISQNDNNIGQNNQDISQTPEVNVVQTETPSIVAKPSSQINQDETDKTVSQTEVPISIQQEPVSQINQDSTARPQEENVSQTDASTSVQQEPVNQSNQDSTQGSQEENVSQTDAPTSVQQEPVNQSNQDSTQGSQEENALTTESPSSVVGELPSQDNQNDSQKPQEEGSTPTELPTVHESPSENDEEKPQEVNEIHTESPISENKPIEQINEDKPASESDPQINSDLEKKPDNQEVVQNENVLATTNPLDTNNDEVVNAPTQPSVSQEAVEAQVSTEQPAEQDHIIMVSPTAPPLYAHDQIKDDVPLQTPAIANENNNHVKDTLTEENKTEISQTPQTPSSDEASSPGIIDTENVPAANPVNVVPENDNKSPNENTSENIISNKIDSSTETKPNENEIVNDASISATESPVDSGEQKPENDQPVNNRFSESPVNKVNLEAVSPSTEANIEVKPDSETGTQTVLLDNSSEPSITQQTEDSATEQPNSLENHDSSETPTNAPPSSDDISEGTTQLPQQQIEDNNIPSQSVNLSPDEPTKTQDEPEKSSEPSESPIDLTSVNNQETTEPQHSDNVENAKPTYAPVSETGEIEQIISTAAPEINDNVALQPQQPQDEATNAIVEATTTFDDPSSSDENDLKVVTESAPINEADVSTTSPEQTAEDEKPVPNTNENIQVENDSTHNPQTEQVNLISSSNNVDSDNSASTNKYTEEVESTVSPALSSSSNDENLNKITPIATPDNKPENENAVEVATENILEDASTNTPIVNANDSPVNTDADENVETGTNAPSSQENQNIQSSTSEPDSYNTQTPVVSQDSGPSNDVTSEVISSIPDTSAPSTDKIQNEVESHSSPSATQVPESESYNTQPPAMSQDSGSSNDVTSEVVSSMTDTNAPSTEKNQNEVESNSLPLATQAPELNIDVVTNSPVESPSIIPTSENNEYEATPTTEINGSPDDKIVEATTVVDDNSQGVPGEGSCLVEFVTYAHKAEVPKSNPCHEKCECLNSIVSCTSINCPPPPPNHRNCIPLHPGNESWCCPTYMCDGGIDQGLIFESHNQVRPDEVSTELPGSKPTEGNDINASGIEQEPNTASPEVPSEYNTLAPTLTDTGANLDNPNISEGPSQPETNKVSENFVTPEKESLAPVTAIYSEPSENENPTENSPASGGVTSVSYENDVSTTSVNKADDAANQNPSISPVSESQDVPAQPTESQNLESSTTKVEPANDQSQPEQQTPELVDTPVDTTNKPDGLPATEQSSDNNANDDIIKTPANEESDVKQTENSTEQPIISQNPSEYTQSANGQADSSPTQLPIETIPNDTRPPSTIDDILSSVNLVKGVLNSLETSSKPSEIYYQPTEAVQVNYETTVTVEGSSFSPSSSDDTSQITSEQTSSSPSSPDDIPQITTEQVSFSPSSSDEPNKPQNTAEEVSSSSSSSDDIPQITTEQASLSPSSSDEPNKPQSTAEEVSSSSSSSDDIPQITTEQASLSPSSSDEPNKPQSTAEEVSSSSSSLDDTPQITTEQASFSPSSSDEPNKPQSTAEEVSSSSSSLDDTPQITTEQASFSPSSSDEPNKPQSTAEEASSSPSSSEDTSQVTSEQESISPPSPDETNKLQIAVEGPSSPSSSDDLPQITTEQASFIPSSSEEQNKPEIHAEGPSSPSSSDDLPQITTEQASFIPSSSEEQNKPEIPAEGPSSPSSSGDIPQTTAGKPESLEEPNQSQPIVEVNAVTNAPELATVKAPESTTQNSPAPIQLEVSTDAAVNKPEENQNSAVPVPEVNANPPESVADKDPEESSPTATNAPSSQYTTAEKTEGVDNRFSSPTSSQRPTQEEIKIPQESGNKVQIPFGTDAPESYRPPSTPVYTHRPSFSSIPQSSWTQKPFHPDSTSESPQPDQGFPDEYEDENEAVFGPGTCRYGGKIYVSAQQVPRDDPCDFCFCFRGDIICLQQSCPPPIFGCFQDTIQGFCCPRYECPVAQATQVNVTTTTTTTTTTVPPHFFANAYRGAARRSGCLIHGHAYKVGEDVGIASGPCMQCICGDDGKMQCNPKACSPEPVLRKMLAEAVDRRR